MHPLLQALFSAWEWRPVVVAILLLFGTAYTMGWLRLRQRGSRLATGMRLASYYGGLLALALSLLSPIDRLGGQLFFMHMIQHLLSMMVAAPLLWLASPFPIVLWGLPAFVRRWATGLLASGAPFRALMAAVTRPGLAWILFIVVYLGWHEPALYNLALRREWVHDVQHMTFFAAAMLYWWHAIGAAPRIHKRLPNWGRMAFLLATIPPNMIAGVVIAFAAAPIYTYYESIPRLWGFSVLQDQQLGGAIMWIPGSMMFLVATLIVLALELNRLDDGSSRPDNGSNQSNIAIASG